MTSDLWEPPAPTPGPWQEFAESGDYWIAHVGDDGMPGGSICSSNDIEAGDVALICAAPDLLDACIAALDVLDELIGAEYDVTGEQAILRSAIAKARGK